MGDDLDKQGLHNLLNVTLEYNADKLYILLAQVHLCTAVGKGNRR